MPPETPAGPSSSIPPGDGPAGRWREDTLRDLLLEATSQLGELRAAVGLDPAGETVDEADVWLYVLVTTHGVRLSPTPALVALPAIDQRMVALDAARVLAEAAEELEAHANRVDRRADP